MPVVQNASACSRATCPVHLSSALVQCSAQPPGHGGPGNRVGEVQAGQQTKAKSTRTAKLPAPPVRLIKVFVQNSHLVVLASTKSFLATHQVATGTCCTVAHPSNQCNRNQNHFVPRWSELQIGSTSTGTSYDGTGAPMVLLSLIRDCRGVPGRLARVISKNPMYM